MEDDLPASLPCLLSPVGTSQRLRWTGCCCGVGQGACLGRRGVAPWGERDRLVPPCLPPPQELVTTHISPLLLL